MDCDIFSLNFSVTKSLDSIVLSKDKFHLLILKPDADKSNKTKITTQLSATLTLNSVNDDTNLVICDKEPLIGNSTPLIC